MRVLLTGAAGRLGRVCWQRLREAGHEVRAVDRQYTADGPDRLELADLLDELGTYRLMESCDAVVHLANHPSMHSRITPQQLYRENVAANMNVFQAASELGVRNVMFASSIQAFGPVRSFAQARAGEPSRTPYLPADGHLPAMPANPYGLSKANSEQMLAFYARQHPDRAFTACRFPALLSEKRLAERRAKAELDEADNSDELFATLRLTEAAELCLAIIEHQRPGYHQYMPANIRPALDKPIAWMLETLFWNVPLRDEKAIDRLVDSSQIEQDLGWRPID